MDYYTVNIGLPPSDAWWTRNQNSGFISTGYDGNIDDKGGRGLRRISAGDIILAYANNYGFVGVGITQGLETYILLENNGLPLGYEIPQHRHQRGVRWTHCARVLIDAIPASETAQQRAPRGNAVQRISNVDAAEQTAEKLRSKLPVFVPPKVLPQTEVGERRNQSSNEPLDDSDHVNIDPFFDAMEGIGREQTITRYGRNRKMRDRKLRESGGLCECCEINFNNILDGRGCRTLQVHHRNQISLLSEPQLNSLDDLAVLCGNCHLMIHANPRLAMSVEELRSIWRYSREIATK
jgi:hypothetical protein